MNATAATTLIAMDNRAPLATTLERSILRPLVTTVSAPPEHSSSRNHPTVFALTARLTASIAVLARTAPQDNLLLLSLPISPMGLTLAHVLLPRLYPTTLLKHASRVRPDHLQVTRELLIATARQVKASAPPLASVSTVPPVAPVSAPRASVIIPMRHSIVFWRYATLVLPIVPVHLVLSVAVMILQNIS